MMRVMRAVTSPCILLALTLGLAGCDDPAQGVAPATIGAREPASPATPSEPGPADDAREHLTIDVARSSVGFTGAKITGSHDGTFAEWSGTVRLDPESIPNSAVDITIQMTSLQIEPVRLLTHLRSDEFFDVENLPTATFRSTQIAEAPSDDGTHRVTGDLTLHGQTRSITFPARITVSPDEVHAQASFSIDRRQFGVVYPGMPDDLIRDDVAIRFDVHAPR